MPYHIRLLKPPRSTYTSPPSITITTTLTISTDLGEYYYPFQTSLYIHILPSSEPSSEVCSTTPIYSQSVVYKPFTRALNASIPISLLGLKERDEDGGRERNVILHVTAKEGPPERADYFQIGEEGDLTPGIMSVWSAPFELNGREAERMVCRRFGLGKMKGEEGKVLKIWEGLGESIAGHVWDAGILLVSHLRDFIHGPGLAEDDPLSGLKSLLDGAQERINVLELGAGCGLVGLALAAIIPHCTVSLTDISEAMHLLHSNVAENQPIMARSASASAHEVDWELTDTQPLDPNRLDGRIEDYSKKGFPPSPVSWDVIVVSDCTYNVDTFSALCSTIRKAAEMSDGLKTWVVVGFKKRHRSETVFSGMIEAKGFDLIERKTMGGDEPTGEMEVHYYRYK